MLHLEIKGPVLENSTKVAVLSMFCERCECIFPAAIYQTFCTVYHASDYCYSIFSQLVSRLNDHILIRKEVYSVPDQHHFQSETDCSHGFMSSSFMWTLNWFDTMNLMEKRGSQLSRF